MYTRLRERFPLTHATGIYDDVIKWKQFPRYWSFLQGIYRSPVNSPHKDQWRGALMFSLICARINGWVNDGEAGGLRRHRTHYDVIVMVIFFLMKGTRLKGAKKIMGWSIDIKNAVLYSKWFTQNSTCVCLWVCWYTRVWMNLYDPPWKLHIKISHMNHKLLYEASGIYEKIISPRQRRAITWTNAAFLSNGPLDTNFCEIQIKIRNFSFKKLNLKILSVKWRPLKPGDIG